MSAESVTSAPRRLRRASWPFGSSGALIFLVGALPAVLFYFRVADSYAAGTALVVLAALCQRWSTGRSPARWPGTGIITLLVCAGIAAHLLLAATFQAVDMTRALSSLAFFYLFLLGSSSLAVVLARISDMQFRKSMRKLGVVMLIVALLGLLGFALPPISGSPWERPFFPFAEPAGFALPLCPILIYLCVTTRGHQRALILALSVLCMALLQTLTLAIGIALVACVSLRKTHLMAFSVVIAGLLTQMDLTYYLERVDFGSESTTNLSNLVYVQGWQLLAEGLERSHYLGQGFQQLGVNGTDVAAAKIINSLLQGSDLNLLDGSFLLAKLGAEFGVFGLLAAAAATAWSLHSIQVLRQVAMGRAQLPALLIFAHAMLAALMLHMFIRSGGYFTGEVFLILTAMWIISRSRSRRIRLTSPRQLVPRRVESHA